MTSRSDISSFSCLGSKWEKQVFHFPEVDTTMNKARELAQKGAPHLSCVVADIQTRGRGRLDRKWVADQGGLWMTLILRPDICPTLAWTCNFAASSSISKILEQMFGLDVKVKWPNDLLLNGKKLSGMISEMITRQGDLDFLLLGIGLNVNNEVSQHEFPAISLKEALEETVSQAQILDHFLTDLSKRLHDLDPVKIISQWKQKTATIGQRVKVETRDNIVSGIAMDVDDSGALLVETTSGKVEKIIYGDCFHEKYNF